MKYKLAYTQTTFRIDDFLRKEFGLEFKSDYDGTFSLTLAKLCRSYVIITEEQALILKLIFSEVKLLPEDCII